MVGVTSGTADHLRRRLGTIELDDVGHGHTFGPGEQLAVARPGVPYRGVAHSTKLRLTVIEPALLNRAAQTADDAATDPVRVLDFRPVSPQAAQRLRRCTAFVRDLVPSTETAPLVVSTAAQYLAANVLNTYPNTAVVVPTPADRRDAHPNSVRRAVAFIAANPDRDIALGDIAAAAHVTPRAIQLAFRRHLDTTPLGYLRQVRLQHAHRQLQDANPDDGTTVTRVAIDWGFASPSRLAAHYRAQYGRPPNQTLRR